jgi:hypothetical protein
VLKDKSQVTVAAALEELTSEFADAKSAVNMRLPISFDQFANSKQALYPVVLRQLPQAANCRGIDGEKLIQAAFGGLDRRWL